MTAIEMPLLRQAITNACAILFLFVFGCFLIVNGVRRFRQLWKQYKLTLAINPSADRKLLLREILTAPDMESSHRFFRENSR